MKADPNGKLSKIAEEIINDCICKFEDKESIYYFFKFIILASKVGFDNMTCMIIKFKK